MCAGALAPEARGGDIVQLTLGQHGGADGAGDDRGEAEPDHHDDGDIGGTKPGQGQEGHDHQRDGEEGVDEPADHLVNRTTQIAHEQAQERAADGAEQCSQRGHGQDVTRAHDDAREHVAPELVGAEPVLGRWRRQRAQEVVGQGVVGGEMATEQGADHPEQHDGQPDHKGGRGRQHLQPLDQLAALDWGGCKLWSVGRRDAQPAAPRRMRGFKTV